MLNEIIQTIFHSDLGNTFNNAALLAFRVSLCYEMIRVHGLKKMGRSGGEAEVVPNPLRLPPKLNQLIADFSDLVAPVLVALGLATRVSVLLILAVTLTGYFVVHGKDASSVRDIPYMYSLSYLFIFSPARDDFRRIFIFIIFYPGDKFRRSAFYV